MKSHNYVVDPDNNVYEPVVPILISTVFDSDIRHEKMAIIDTGAQASYIPPSLIEELRLIPIREKSETMVGVTGEDESFAYAINITFNEKPYDAHVVYESKITDENYVIIGLDILNDFHICFDGPQKILNFLEDTDSICADK